MEESQAMPGRGNGNIAQITKPLSPDLEQLTQDWRAFGAGHSSSFSLLMWGVACSS